MNFSWFKAAYDFLGLFPLEKPKMWALGRAMLTTLPVVIVTFADYQYSVNEPKIHQDLKSVLEGDPWHLLLLLGLPFFVSLICEGWESFARFRKTQEPSYFPFVHLITTLSALNVVVAKKQKRFGEVAKRMLGSDLSCERAFKEITQPEQQNSRACSPVC